MQQELTRLRATLAETQTQLIEAEAELADQLAEINAFEFEFEAKVGHLLDTLEALEKEIQRYNERIQLARNKQVFGYAHISIDEQYRRTWQAPRGSAATPPPRPLSAAGEIEIKKLYRQLARRFHPDLATNETDRARRTEKMQAINDAYGARSLTELVALADEPDVIDIGRRRAGQTEAQLVEALQAELVRCRHRMQEIEKEMRNLRYRPSVEVSLEVKAARRQGRDLLAERAAELEKKIARTTVERDMLKAQFDQLGPEQGVISIDRY
jgi:chromosome segregation ATPase